MEGFSEKAGKKLHVALQYIFGRDFLSLHSLSIENYPNSSMSLLL